MSVCSLVQNSSIHRQSNRRYFTLQNLKHQNIHKNAKLHKIFRLVFREYVLKKKVSYPIGDFYA